MRNLAPLELPLGAGVNVVSGDNGQGKTNLLEAIYAVFTLRSFRTSAIGDLVGFGLEGARVAARANRLGLERVYELRLERQGSRVLRSPLIDGKAIRPVAKYFGDVHVVLFAPEDLAVPRGSPAERRRFLDRAVFNWRPSYLADAQTYDKVLRSRNALLRRALRDGARLGDELLAVYDETLCEVGARVTEARMHYVDALRPGFQRAYAAITRTRVKVDIAYALKLSPAARDDSTGLAGWLAHALGERRAVDRARGTTTVGPHRDDLAFLLDDHPADLAASQGQLRAMILSWKIAEMDVVEVTRGAPPLLLLDDVSSELDDLRNTYLFDFIREKSNQSVITTTHPRHVLLSGHRTDFSVVQGVVSSQNSG